MSQSIRTRARMLTVAAVLLLGLLLLAACGSATTPSPAAPTQPAAEPAAPTAQPTEVAIAPTAAPTNTTAPTATIAATATQEPTATATEAPTPTAVVVADASNCVACHTSEETLQKLAKEEDPTESLSEGEG